MRIFKNKFFRRILAVLLLLVFLILLDTWMGDLLSPVTYAFCFNHDVQQIEKTGKNADIVFVGASRVYRTFVPQILEEKLGVDCVVNAGSSAQPICGTYYQLKDLIERLHPRRVFLGVTWDQAITNADLQEKLIVLDRLSLRNRLLMAVNCFSIEEMRYLSGTYRFKDNFTLEKIKSNIDSKNNLISNGFNSFSKKDEYYADTGFVYSYATFDQGNIPLKKMGGFSAEKTKDSNMHYLDACIELCQQNNIEVSLVVGVTSMMRLYMIGNYQDAVDFYSSYAQNHSIPFYNLNYLVGREEFLPDSCMHDSNHVNGEGAHIVTAKLAEILNQSAEGKDISGFFYENLDELKKDVHRIVAVKADITADPDSENHLFITISSAQNDDVEPVYRVLLRRSGEDGFEVLRDWSPQAQLDLQLADTEGATLRIEAASADETYGHAFQEYDL